MSHIIERIKERRSVRSYDGHLIDDMEYVASYNLL